MSENRRRVLDMLAEGKISVDEAERLLSLVDSPAGGDAPPGRPGAPKYLRVTVKPEAGDHGAVNLRVPVSLIRAGVKLASVMPGPVAEHVNFALKEHGVDVDVRRLDSASLDALIEALGDLEVDVQEGDYKVRVYVE